MAGSESGGAAYLRTVADQNLNGHTVDSIMATSHSEITHHVAKLEKSCAGKSSSFNDLDQCNKSICSLKRLYPCCSDPHRNAVDSKSMADYGLIIVIF